MEHAEKVRKLLIFKENSQYGHLSVFSNGFGVIRGEENNHKWGKKISEANKKRHQRSLIIHDNSVFGLLNWCPWAISYLFKIYF